MSEQNHIHSFVDSIIPATCQEIGYTLHRCACGYEYKDQYTPKANHAYETLERRDATCFEDGAERLRCRVCGVEQSNALPAKGHGWGKWNIRTMPGCTEEGVQFRVCGYCGKQEEQVVPARGHSWGPWGIKQEPTCTEEGIQTHFCSRCGMTEEGGIPVVAHQFSSPKKSKTVKGARERCCENCGHVVVEQRKRNKALRRVIAALVAVALLSGITWAILPVLKPAYHYYMGKFYLSQRQYTKAYYHLRDCRKLDDEYKDIDEMLKYFVVICEEKTNYDEDGDVTSIVEQSYDEENNKIFTATYDADRNLQYLQEEEYDWTGDQILEANYDKYRDL